MRNYRTLGFIVTMIIGGALPAGAETITLADGRVLADARIIGQSAARVTIKYTQGLVSVYKAELPEELRKKYPETAEQPAPPKPPAAIVPVIRQPVVAETKRELPSIRVSTLEPEGPSHSAARKAMPLLTEYFAKNYRPMGGSVEPLIKLHDEVVPVEGWSGRWRLRGVATLRNYREMNPQRKYELDRMENLSPKERNRLIYNETAAGSQIVEFDVEIYDLETEAKISVTRR